MFMIHWRSGRIYGKIYSPNGDLRVVSARKSCRIYNGISNQTYEKILEQHFITNNLNTFPK